MSDSQGILLFTNDSGGGGTSSDYEKDVFQDVSLPANNNSGLSSSFTTNPLSEFFANDAAPKWMAKTLFIKDLQRVQDRSLWINGRATYNIVWHEEFPSAQGYCFGSIGLSGTSQGRTLTVGDINDGVGVGGVIRRVMWLVKPSATATATATPYTDGIADTQINYGAYTSVATINAGQKAPFYAFTTQSSNATYDLHDHRLLADQANLLNIVGCIVYYNVAGDGIDCFPGDTYVNKAKVSLSGTTLGFPPGVSSFLGGYAGVFASSTGDFGITTTLCDSVSAVCSGASGTNLLAVGIGSGASFPNSTAIYVPNGSTYYAGTVTNSSGDVLTISPTLPFGLSNICSSIFYTGSSLVIGTTNYQQSWSYYPGVQNQGFSSTIDPQVLPLSYSDPYMRYRAWGSTLFTYPGFSISSGLGATYGLGGFTIGSFFQVEGKFEALEFEFLAGQSAALGVTFTVDGLNINGFSTAINGPTVFRKQVMANAGVGWHSVRMNEAGSTNILLTGVVGYRHKYTNGPSFGNLAEIPVGMSFVTRNAQNASLMAFGPVTRIYAEQLGAKGSWAKNTALTNAGGAGIQTTTDTDTVNFQYFGTRFAVLGSLGTSTVFNVDGVSLTVGANAWLGSGLTLGFHNLVLTHKAGTTRVDAIDYLNPAGEVLSLQNYFPLPEGGKLVRCYQQSAVPSNANPGDIWEQDVLRGAAFQRLFGGWKKVQTGDPIPRRQVFTANGAFTVPAGVTEVNVTCTGGGGGGGGAQANGGGASSNGGGGGGGGTTLLRVTSLIPGTAIAVTVGAAGAAGAAGANNGGAGGDSSFGSYCTGGGGGGGDGGASSSGYLSTGGGNAGSGSGGDMNFKGSSGGRGVVAAGNRLSLGYGGSSYFSGIQTAPSGAGLSNGGGGAGASTSTTADAGGAGAAGVVIVEWVDQTSVDK